MENQSESSSKHVTAFRLRHASPNETIVATGDGYIGEMMGKGKDTQHNGVLIVTNERVAFYRKGFLGEVLETIPLKAISSIERKSLLGHRTLCLHTSNDELRFKTFSKPSEDALVKAIEEGRRGGTKPEIVEAESSTTQGPLESIRQLGDLHKAGLITQAEFEAKKADLLSRL